MPGLSRKNKCQLFWRDERFQAVHAGIKADPIETNDTYTLIHDHEIVLQNQYSGPLTVVGHIALDFLTWFKATEKRQNCCRPENG